MFVSVQKILRKNRVCSHRSLQSQVPAWYKSAEFKPQAQTQFPLLKKSLSFPSDILRPASAAPSPRLGPDTSHLLLGHSAGTGCETPVPLTHHVDTASRKCTAPSQLSPGGTWSVEGTHGISRDIQAQLLLSLVAVHLKHNHYRCVKLPLETANSS